MNWDHEVFLIHWYQMINHVPQVTEDLKVITEEDEAAPEDGGEAGQTKAPQSPRTVQPLPPPPSPLSLHPRGPLRRTPSLSKRESLMSINRQVCQDILFCGM